MSTDEMNDEGFCRCTSCGEEFAVPIDLSAGSKQEYVQHCPKCCHPNIINIEVENNEDVRVWVTVPIPESKPPVPFDVVQEASEESFPASDSPAF